MPDDYHEQQVGVTLYVRACVAYHESPFESVGGRTIGMIEEFLFFFFIFKNVRNIPSRGNPPVSHGDSRG